MAFNSSHSMPGIAGLGITFLPSSPPPPPTPPKNSQPPLSQRGPRQSQLRQQFQQQQPRKIHHSQSYDCIPSNHGRYDDYEGVSAAMFRMHSDEGTNSEGEGEQDARRRVRIASGSPEVFGRVRSGGGDRSKKVDEPKKGLYLASHLGGHNIHRLSPFSDASSSNDSNTFSPTSVSMTSLPSDTNSINAYYSSFDDHQRASHIFPIHGTDHNSAVSTSQSPSYLPYNNAQAEGMTYDQSSEQADYDPLEFYHREVSPAPPQPEPQTSPSRLPAFLQNRLRNGVLSRPKSMMELGKTFALHSIKESQGAEDFAPRSRQAPIVERSTLEDYDESEEQDMEGSPSTDPYGSHIDLLSVSEARRPSTLPPGAAYPPQHAARSRSLSTSDAPRLPSELLALRLDRSEELTTRRVSEVISIKARSEADDEIDLSPRRTEGVFVEDLPSQSELSPAKITRQPTLLTPGANAVTRKLELDRLLDPSVKSSSLDLKVPSLPSFSPITGLLPNFPTAQLTNNSGNSTRSAGAVSVPVVLEQAKNTSKARVEMDLVLESSLVVEGGTVKGTIEIRLKKLRETEGAVLIGNPKIRVVGFEEIAAQDARHVFYHYAGSVSSVEDAQGLSLSLPCHNSEADEEGYHEGISGQHFIPFKLLLPIGKGAKGSCKVKQGVVRYIVIASVKIKSGGGEERSIAHFYRHVEIYPYYDPTKILAPAPQLLTATTSKALFMGGAGKVSLTVNLHRATWIAGQRVYVDVCVHNESSKKIKLLILSLMQTTSVYRPRPLSKPDEIDHDPQACQTQATSKKIAETILEQGKKGTKGVTAKGSWIGVETGQKLNFAHSLLIPMEALTMPRGRHLEVAYTLRVSVSGSLSADVTSEVPIQIINFVSIDPPPGHLATTTSKSNVLSTISHSPLENFRRGHRHIASVDSICLADLNPASSKPDLVPQMSRLGSLDTLTAENTSEESSNMTRGVTLPNYLDQFEAQGKAIVGAAKERQLNHQMSLECISSAIASATARRFTIPSPKSEVRRDSSVLSLVEEEDLEIPEEAMLYYGGGGGGDLYNGLEDAEEDVENRLQLDDLDDIPDSEVYYKRNIAVSEGGSENNSDEELEAVFSSATFGEDELVPFSPAKATAPVPSPRRSPLPSATAQTANRVPRPTSPLKISTIPSASSTAQSLQKRSSGFGFATPASPIKAGTSPPVLPSPTRQYVARLQPTFSAAPIGRVLPRALPSPPLPRTSPTKVIPSTSILPTPRLQIVKKVSSSALKRSSVVLKKTSTRNLRTTPSLSDLSSVQERHSPTPASSGIDLYTRVRPASTLLSTRPPFDASPRKGTSPSLYTSKSMGDLRSKAALSSPLLKQRTALPSVLNKVAALESREKALSRLNTRSAVDNSTYTRKAGLMRSNSIAESEMSFKLGDLERGNSIVSFKAPMFRN